MGLRPKTAVVAKDVRRMVNKRSYARGDVYKAATIKVRAEW